MIGSTDSHLSGQLVLALKERQSAINISTSPDGRFVARYSYNKGGKKIHLYVSGDNIPATLDALTRKVRATFHPRETAE